MCYHPIQICIYCKLYSSTNKDMKSCKWCTQYVVETFVVLLWRVLGASMFCFSHFAWDGNKMKLGLLEPADSKQSKWASINPESARQKQLQDFLTVNKKKDSLNSWMYLVPFFDKMLKYGMVMEVKRMQEMAPLGSKWKTTLQKDVYDWCRNAKKNDNQWRSRESIYSSNCWNLQVVSVK